MAQRKRVTHRNLSKERITEAALKLIEADGLDAFSMRTLAARLKVQPMSLYHHFPSRLDLLNGVLDLALAEMSFFESSKPWEERLYRAAREWRRIARLYPRFYPFLALHRLNTEMGLKTLESVLEIFFAAGADKESCARHFRTLGYYLMGAALDEVAGYGAGPAATHPLPPEEEARRFPQVMAVGEFFEPEHFEKTFELGLRNLIEAFKASVPKR